MPRRARAVNAMDLMGKLSRHVCMACSPKESPIQGQMRCTLAPHDQGPHVAHGPDKKPLLCWLDGEILPVPEGSRPAL